MIPRSLVVLALLLATSASALASQDVLPKTRKTVAFGHPKPHARFVVNDRAHSSQSLIAVPSRDPFQVAEQFVKSLLPDDKDFSFYIRKDSYTDPATRVTHVYAKQVYQGIVVADGDVNVNIKDGKVISHGNEFWPHGHVNKRDQIPLQSLPSEQKRPLNDPRLSLLSLMAMVTPSGDLSEAIDMNPEPFLEKMDAFPVHSLMPNLEEPGAMEMTLTGAPEALGNVKGKLVWHQTAEGGLELGWKFLVEMTDNYYEAVLSALDSRVFSIVDWVSDSSLPLYMPDPELLASIPITYNKFILNKPSNEPKKPTVPDSEADPQYMVFAWGINDPEESNRTLELHSKWADKLASPLGWHTVPLANLPDGLVDIDAIAPTPKPMPLYNFTETVGNNVLAQENFQGRNEYLHNFRPDATADMNFTFVYDPQPQNDTAGRMKEARDHINATVTQLFYTTNLFHDLTYRYGFDEISGNFQMYNFGKGGAEHDAVIANAQDGSGFNNANFMTPPDGTSGRMRMYLWNTATPYRDGDFEAGIVIHELAHGLSTRLTGGPMDSSCLGFGESGGMGEGWGDFLATTIRSTGNYSDYPMGSWAANQARGIRNFPYSLNHTVNPETYKSVDSYFGVHPIGEVWAEMLWVVEQRLIEKHGFTESLFPPAPLEDGTIPVGDFYRTSSKPSAPMVPKHGNSLMIQLVLNGMKLQKCRPGFLDARDAIIQADDILTGGENFCDIWLGFADRGLGTDAKVVGMTPWGGGIRTNGYAVPKACSV